MAAAPFIYTSSQPKNAAAIFAIAFLSHFALDAIPHEDYKLNSFTKNNGSLNFKFKKVFFLKDFIKVFLDFSFGIIVAFGLYNFDPKILYVILVAAFASILPDLLNTAYFISKKSLFVQLHKIHAFFHSKHESLNPIPKKILLQIPMVMIIVILFKEFF